MKNISYLPFKQLLIDGSISYGIVQPGKHQEYDSTPIIRVNNFHGRRLDISDVLKVSNDIEKNYSRTRLNGGELLITVVGSIGSCVIAPECVKGWNVARAVAVGRIKKEYDIKFIMYQFESDDIKFQLYGNTNDTVQPTLNLSSLKEIVFKIPSLAEQRAIASVLSSLDDKIDLLHRQNATLEAMAEALFRQWFVVEAKEEWEEVSVADVAEINAQNIGKDYPYSDIKYLDTGSLAKGTVTKLQHFDIDNAPSRAQRLVKHNDILLSMVRPNQMHYGLINNPDENLVVSTGFCVISCKKINPYFLYTFLTSSEMTEYLHSIAEGSTSAYPSLKPSDIEELTFLCPPSDMLEEFDKFVNPAWDKIMENQRQIRTLEKLRDTLLPKLMSGEVRVDMA